MKVFCKAIPSDSQVRRCGACGARGSFYVFVGDLDGKINNSSRRTICAVCKDRIFKPKPEPEKAVAN